MGRLESSPANFSVPTPSLPDASLQSPQQLGSHPCDGQREEDPNLVESSRASFPSKRTHRETVSTIVKQPVKVIRLLPPVLEDLKPEPVSVEDSGTPTHFQEPVVLTRKRRVKCSKCYCRLTEDELEEHMKTHESKRRKKEDLEKEAKIFSFSSDEEEDDPDGQRRCPYCFATVPVAKVREHVTLGLCVCCRLCRRLFPSLEVRNAHEANEHGTNGKSLPHDYNKPTLFLVNNVLVFFVSPLLSCCKFLT